MSRAKILISTMIKIDGMEFVGLSVKLCQQKFAETVSGKSCCSFINYNSFNSFTFLLKISSSGLPRTQVPGAI